ncbi:MAG: hypothetical protein JNM38_11695 [Acidobacteria bacterium]|nr:hypothetical protein [Acidobacteriota bacterium]
MDAPLDLPSRQAPAHDVATWPAILLLAMTVGAGGRAFARDGVQVTPLPQPQRAPAPGVATPGSTPPAGGQVVPREADAGASSTVVASGSATVFGGNVDAARRAALQAAYAEAVGQASGVEVGRLTVVRDVKTVSDIVAARSRGFVRSYDILGERLVTNGDVHRYEVSIRAVVAARDLGSDDDVEGLRLYLDLIGRPTVLVLLPDAELPALQDTEVLEVSGDAGHLLVEQRKGTTVRAGTPGLTALGTAPTADGSLRAAEAAVAQALARYGYQAITSDELVGDPRVAPAQVEAARRGVTTQGTTVARAIGADLVLSGLIRVSTQRVAPQGVAFISATTAASARALVASNGAVVDAFHRTVTKAHPSALGAVSMTLDAVAAELAGALAWKIPAILSSQPRVTRVVVRSATLETAQQVKASFEAVPGVDVVRFVTVPTSTRPTLELDLLSGYVVPSVEELIGACAGTAQARTCRLESSTKFETTFTLLPR